MGKVRKGFKQYCKECGRLLVKDGADINGYNEKTGKPNNVQYWSCPEYIRIREEEIVAYKKEREEILHPKWEERFEKDLEKYNRLPWICRLFKKRPETWQYREYTLYPTYPFASVSPHAHKIIEKTN